MPHPGKYATNQPPVDVDTKILDNQFTSCLVNRCLIVYHIYARLTIMILMTSPSGPTQTPKYTQAITELINTKYHLPQTWVYLVCVPTLVVQGAF